MKTCLHSFSPGKITAELKFSVTESNKRVASSVKDTKDS